MKWKFGTRGAASGAAAAIENPHVAAGKRWHNDRYLDLALARRNWMIGAFLLSGAVVVLSSSLAWLAAQSRVQPYVAVIDGTYKVLALGPAQELGDDDQVVQRVAQTEVIEFIRNARSITADPLAQIALMEAVWTHSAADTRQMLTNFYGEASPGLAAQQGRRVSVEIESVLLRSDRTWDVRWTEIEWDPSGLVRNRERWGALLAVDRIPPQDPEQAVKNPLGLYITRLSWSRLIRP